LDTKAFVSVPLKQGGNPPLWEEELFHFISLPQTFTKSYLKGGQQMLSYLPYSMGFRITLSGEILSKNTLESTKLEQLSYKCTSCTNTSITINSSACQQDKHLYSI
jgi:hypothetical protein